MFRNWTQKTNPFSSLTWLFDGFLILNRNVNFHIELVRKQANSKRNFDVFCVFITLADTAWITTKLINPNWLAGPMNTVKQ